MRALCTILDAFLLSLKLFQNIKNAICQNKTKNQGWEGGEEHCHLLLRGRGVQGVRGARGVREDQAVRGCHLGQGGLRVPGAGEGGRVSTGQEPRPPPALHSPEPTLLTLGPRGPVSPLGPFGVGREETGLEKGRALGSQGRAAQGEGRGLPPLLRFPDP